jgi:hypothetical protein
MPFLKKPAARHKLLRARLPLQKSTRCDVRGSSRAYAPDAGRFLTQTVSYPDTFIGMGEVVFTVTISRFCEVYTTFASSQVRGGGAGNGKSSEIWASVDIFRVALGAGSRVLSH